MNPHRAILGAAVPLYLSMVASMVGALVVVSTLGRHATATLAAFALAGAVSNPASAAVTGVMRGLMPFLAPVRDDPDAAVPVIRDARWLAMSVGAAGALAVACVPVIARAGGVPGEIVGELGVYPILSALSIMVVALSGGANSTLIALGHNRQVLWSGLTTTALTVTLTFALVPSLGLTGAGIAQILSACAGVAVSNACLRRSPLLKGRSLRPGRPRTKEIIALARVGIPLAGTVLIKFAVLGVVAFAAARLGPGDGAVHTILTSLIGFIMVASIAVAQASIPVVARAAGPREARRAIRAALMIAVAGASAGAAVLVLSGDAMLALFTDDAAVADRVLVLLPLMLLSAMADACQAVMGFGLTGLKRSSASLISFAILYGLLALAAFPVATAAGLTGLWTTLIATNLLLAAAQGGNFLRHSALVRPVPVPA
ncbi:MATE family multidrug resistance protein [Streptosporangium album]|uniref:Probable multidrug resistance protein NorM n=1 Tax=Streptosporangium album TaxID=47479 RepID=A0A7W7RTN6_9ACTN|nr:MATE family efflux transporter [Streptosporangium album]MBB4938004.1 MATE family multidrug resistance protein [Streptosporangium album]